MRNFYEFDSCASVTDLDWNHMDPHHRPFVHRTYGKVEVIQRHAESELLMVRWRRWLPRVEVVNVHVAPGVFGQRIRWRLLSSDRWLVLTAHLKIGWTPTVTGSKVRVSWEIDLPRFLRFPFVRILDEALYRLNRRQNLEDETQVRIRRTRLRRCGFTFASDPPTFLSCAALTRQVYSECSSEQLVKEGICPHQGGPIDPKTGYCPWHGLTFKTGDTNGKS